jgi:hypothetical protein
VTDIRTILERAEGMDQERRYVVTECPSDPSLWAVEDFAADGDFMWRYPVMGCVDREDAEEWRARLVVAGVAEQLGADKFRPRATRGKRQAGR